MDIAQVYFNPFYLTFKTTPIHHIFVSNINIKADAGKKKEVYICKVTVYIR